MKKARQRKKPAGATYEEFLQLCKERGEKPLPPTDLIFEYAKKIKLPIDFLRLAWREFAANYSSDEKRQVGIAGWRAVFRKLVRQNWYHLWFKDERGDWALTTAGKQAEAAHAESRQQRTEQASSDRVGAHA